MKNKRSENFLEVILFINQVNEVIATISKNRLINQSEARPEKALCVVTCSARSSRPVTMSPSQLISRLNPKPIIHTPNFGQRWYYLVTWMATTILLFLILDQQDVVQMIGHWNKNYTLIIIKRIIIATAAPLSTSGSLHSSHLNS